jgi:hypothetical protein
VKTRLVKNILLTGMVLLAMLGELLAGRVGWVLPLVMPVLFFISLNVPWYKAGFAVVFIGAAWDLAWGRDFPVSIIAFLVMLLAAYRLRRKQPSELPEVFTSVLGAMAAGEAVYAIASDNGWLSLLQWIFLTVGSTILTLLIIQSGRFLLELLEIPDCFTPRSSLWKRRRLQNASTRNPQS